MAKKSKNTPKSNVGLKLMTGSGSTYTLLSDTATTGEQLYQYKWFECPDKDYIFESKKPYDSLDMANAIIMYKLQHRIYK